MTIEYKQIVQDPFESYRHDNLEKVLTTEYRYMIVWGDVANRQEFL